MKKLTGNVIVDARKPIEEVIAATPEGETAMFAVSVSRDEFLLGEMLYVKGDDLFECMSDNRVPRSSYEVKDLRFMGYIRA